MGREGIATEHAGFKRNAAQLPVVWKVQSLLDLGVCAQTQSICSTEAEYFNTILLGRFMGENTLVLINVSVSPIDLSSPNKI